ncbi:hypothetical protein [Spirosoma sp. KNUC1025]|uniref:hypothetical protein n=1 Tax=Spirosoma sp. KNUC1025 TaxID=2894082 RepID=UPI00386EEEA6|nr:hypothetical protein LN737_15845 [Spirosoma sp. KNUC1025]
MPILVDPTNDASPVSFSFKTIDNAGQASANTGTATVSSTLTTMVSGKVWDDADGNLSQNGSENATNAGGPLYVNLVNASNTVVTSVSVATDGSYSLSGVPINVTGYKLVLASTATATTPGTLPTGWVNTGENVDATNTATQGSTLGVIELAIASSAVVNQNFGIEKMPTPGSGTATATNLGGSSAVTVPPTAFTSVSPSSDTAPGSVTAIHITAFPTNTTSLTINGTVYTSANFPVGGVTVPTDGSGIPTVPVSVNPTNDSNPVVFTFTAIDNAGKESVTTGTATLNSIRVPDLTPIIYARPSTTYNTTNISVVVDVFELSNVATSGLITVKLTKDPKITLSFPGTATSVGGRTVSNGAWSFDGELDDYYYILTTTQVVGAGNVLSFGLTGKLTPGATSGTLTLTTVIDGGSGGEVKITNNTDADKIDFFQQ